MTTIAELAKRVQLLEDIEAIKRLKARYAKACDDNYNAEEIAKEAKHKLDTITREVQNLLKNIKLEVYPHS